MRWDEKFAENLILWTFFIFYLPQKSGICYTVTRIREYKNSKNGMRADMAEDIKQRIVNKRKCAYAMKRFNIKIFVVAIVILCAWCGFLLAKVHVLEQTMQTTSLQLEEMKELLVEQQSILGELAGGTNPSEGAEADGNMSGTGGEEITSESPEDNGSGETEAADGVEAAHKVYLTFDDGPSIYTEEILDILDQYDVKATFFVVGKETRTAEELLKEIVDRGHSLGAHSYSHDYSKIYESVDSFAEDFMKLQDYLYDVTGVRTTLYRFPGGSSNTVSDIDMQQFADYLKEQGVTFYDWNISSGDGGSIQLPVENLVENCTKDIKNWKTSIVLLHDSGDKRTTVDALPTIIENILAVEDTVILPITEETRPVQHMNQ